MRQQHDENMMFVTISQIFAAYKINNIEKVMSHVKCIYSYLENTSSFCYRKKVHHVKGSEDTICHQSSKVEILPIVSTTRHWFYSSFATKMIINIFWRANNSRLCRFSPKSRLIVVAPIHYYFILNIYIILFIYLYVIWNLFWFNPQIY